MRQNSDVFQKRAGELAGGKCKLYDVVANITFDAKAGSRVRATPVQKSTDRTWIRRLLDNELSSGAFQLNEIKKMKR